MHLHYGIYGYTKYRVRAAACASIHQLFGNEPKRLPYNITNRKNGANQSAFATITSKGQTTIPKEVRAAANLKSGDRIHFTVLEDGTIIVRVKNRSIRDISFKPPGGKRVSIAQMTR